MSTATNTTELTAEDYEALIEVIDLPQDSFQRWIRGGMDEQDIDCIHAPNVIGSVRQRVAYLKVRNRLLDRYLLTEEELVAQAMRRYAASSR